MNKIALAPLRAEQQQLAAKVIKYDHFNWQQPRFIGGADVGFEAHGTITRAVMVILSYPELTLIEYQIARLPTGMPYIPGYLSFREYPALYQAWQQLTQKPDLLLVDGQGIAHPRRIGIASHLGVQLAIPTIGVAKSKLWGEYSVQQLNEQGESILYDKQEQLGWVLQSKSRCRPLFISPGDRIGYNSSLFWVKQCLAGYRLPEPTRLADAIASQRTGWQPPH